MKTTVTKQPKHFNPVTISVTFESQEELSTWLKMRCDLEWINNSEDCVFFAKMFPSETTYFNLP
jgi:hypothetical protein